MNSSFFRVIDNAGSYGMEYENDIRLYLGFMVLLSPELEQEIASSGRRKSFMEQHHYHYRH